MKKQSRRCLNCPSTVRTVLFALVTCLVILCRPTALGLTPPPTLRQGVDCSQSDISIAQELVTQGWHYLMPMPKSPQAAWGNRDGRTTWYVGYWVGPNGALSQSQPSKDSNGVYVGDGLGSAGWRRGGSPRFPTKIEWLCSRNGGPPASAIN